MIYGRSAAFVFQWTFASIVSYWIIMSFNNGALATDDFDASQITWAHAVNNRSELEKALKSKVSFLEADVLMGQVTGQPGETVIMAHPPAVESDITLGEWLDTVYKTDPSRGVKLDYKSGEALQKSKDVLEKRKAHLPTTMWLNADILPGPVYHLAPMVKPPDLLSLCRAYPGSTLSPGWTTSVFLLETENARYTWQDVWLMSRTLSCDIHTQKCPHITFPVRAIYVRRSIPQLSWLTSVVGPNASLTVWSSPTDTLDVQDLLLIRRAFPKSQVYYDLPENQANEFERIKNTVTYEKDLSFHPELWGVLRRESEPFGCDDATNISSGVQVVYGGRRDVAVVQNVALTYPIEIKAKLVPYELADYDGEYTCRPGDLNVVLATDPSFWEGKWWLGSAIGQSVVAFGIADPCRNASDCALDWTLRINNASEVPQLTTNETDCPVDVTQFPLDLSNGSVFWVGLIFRGERAMVLENLQITGTEVHQNKTTSSALKPYVTGSLLSSAIVFLVTSWYL